MAEKFGGEENVSKREGLARTVNRFLQSLVVRCTRDEGVYHYFDIGIFGYGSRLGSCVSLLPSSLTGQDLASISDIADNVLHIDELSVRKPDAEGKVQTIVEKVPVWVEAASFGDTPMCRALTELKAIVSQWIQSHNDSFPPIIIHITDGGSTDGNPLSIAQEVRNLSTSDGRVLLFNCHLSSTQARPILFPASSGGLEKTAGMLYEMSSELPPSFVDAGRQTFPEITEGSHGFAYNAGIIELIQFIDMGTRASNSLR